MQTQGTSSFIKLSNTKPQDNQSRGFKPVISIPIVVQPQNPQSHNTQLKDTNLPLEIKLNNFYQEYLKLVKEHKLIRTTIDHVNRQKAELEERFNSLQVICQIIKVRLKIINIREEEKTSEKCKLDCAQFSVPNIDL